MFIELDGKRVGYPIARSGYRISAWKVLDWFKRKYQVYLLSGDNDRERGFLESKFETGDLLFSNQSPQEKLEFVQQQQGLGQIVLMVGGGLNDAGALKSSDVGIVIAEDTSNFTPACDAILDARSFSRFPELLTYASSSISVVYFAWVVAAVYNLIGLNFAVQGERSPVVAAILMPLSSVSIVGIGVGLSTYYAWGLSTNT
jgi:Cu+-exporting ATPase